MRQANAVKKRRGRTREELMAISKGTQWKKGQSGGGHGPLPEKAISQGLREFYSKHPEEFKKYLSAAHKKSIGSKASAKFWELIAERVEGKVASQVDVRALVVHLASESEKKTAQTTIESIKAFESKSSEAIAGELAEEKTEDND